MRYLVILTILFSGMLFSQSSSGLDSLPTSEQNTNATTAAQDSAYKRALQDDIPNFLRLKESLMMLEMSRVIQRRSRNNPWAAAKRNLAEIPSEYYTPTENEIIRHNEVIMASQYIPTFNNWPQNNGGISIPLAAIGRVLGLTEDTSPTINFELKYYDDVEIVVYSVQAVVIAQIFKGKLSPGKHSRTWNGRDDEGKKMPAGDYIIEVRVGESKYIRKWVKIN